MPGQAAQERRRLNRNRRKRTRRARSSSSSSSTTVADAPAGETVTVFSLDYDDCADILCPDGQCAALQKNLPAGRIRAVQTQFYEQCKNWSANSSEVVLMLGSNRQDYGVEAHASMLNGTGFATRNFPYLRSKMSDACGKEIQLFKALRADGEKEPGTEWDLIEKGVYLQNVTNVPVTDPEYTVAPSTYDKTALLQWQISKLQQKFGAKIITFTFAMTSSTFSRPMQLHHPLPTCN